MRMPAKKLNAAEARLARYTLCLEEKPAETLRRLALVSRLRESTLAGIILEAGLLALEKEQGLSLPVKLKRDS